MSPGKIVGWSFVVALVAVPIAVVAVGGGHGSYAPARVLFPFTMLSTVIGNEIARPFSYIGIVQYPVYGGLLALFHKYGLGKVATIGIATVHSMAVAGVFIFHNGSFPN